MVRTGEFTDRVSSDWPVELRLGDADRSAVLGRRRPTVTIAARVAEAAVGEHHEGVRLVAEVAVPTARVCERTFERFHQPVGFVVGRLELDERPRAGLAGADVAEV